MVHNIWPHIIWRSRSACDFQTYTCSKFTISRVNRMITRLNSGIRNWHNFLCVRFFYFKKLELIQWIVQFYKNPILNFFSIFFENAWVTLICVGVSLSRFELNLRNFSSRKIHFEGFIIPNFFPRRVAPIRLVSIDAEFNDESENFCQKVAGGCPRTVSPTQKLKSPFSNRKF